MTHVAHGFIRVRLLTDILVLRYEINVTMRLITLSRNTGERKQGAEHDKSALSTNFNRLENIKWKT